MGNKGTTDISTRFFFCLFDILSLSQPGDDKYVFYFIFRLVFFLIFFFLKRKEIHGSVMHARKKEDK